MRFTKHAKNRLRLYGLAESDAEFVLSNPVQVGRDPKGNRRYLGQVEGNWIRVVVAGDDPGLVLTVHPRRHR